MQFAMQPSLSSLNLAPQTIAALHSANITTIPQLLTQTPHLQNSLPASTLHSIKTALYSQTSARPIQSPTSRTRLSTNSPSLSKSLDGGWPSSAIIQLAGGTQSGKTQIALSAVATALDAGHTAIWLDASSSAAQPRIEMILSARGRDERFIRDALSRMVFLAVPTAQRAVEVLRDVEFDQIALAGSGVSPGMLGSVLRSPRVVVVDSVGGLLGPLLGLRTAGWSGHVVLNEMGVLLRGIATRGASVFVTNRMVGGVGFEKPALGNAWACFPDVDVRLVAGMKEGCAVCVEAVVESKWALRRTCSFWIDVCGVCDA